MKTFRFSTSIDNNVVSREKNRFTYNRNRQLLVLNLSMVNCNTMTLKRVNVAAVREYCRWKMDSCVKRLQRLQRLPQPTDYERQNCPSNCCSLLNRLHSRNTQLTQPMEIVSKHRNIAEVDT